MGEMTTPFRVAGALLAVPALCMSITIAWSTPSEIIPRTTDGELRAPRGSVFLIGGEGAAGWVDWIGDEARRAAVALPAYVGVELPDTVRIALCATADEFRRYAGGMDLRGVLGVARPDADVLALNMALLGPGIERSLRGTLRHELSHIALGAAARRGGVVLPRWFDEGVASWFGGRYTDMGPLEVATLIHASWLRLDALTDRFPHEPERRPLAYLKSLTAIERLEGRRPGAVARLLWRVEAGEAFDEALLLAAGLTVADLDQGAGDRARQRWLRSSLIEHLASPYAALAVVVIAAFLIRRRRFRRRLAELDDDGPS